MIFKVILNGSRVIYDGNNPTGILDPQLEIELNAAGSFTFILPSGSDVINDITPFTSEIDVYEDDEMIWFGRVLNKEKVWNNQCKITCEGGLAYFNDSIQDKKTWESASDGDVTMTMFFRDLIDWHNDQVSSERQWEVGTIAPEFGLSKIWRETNRETTSDCLQTMCLDTDGGYFITRKEYVIDPTEGRVAKRYIDWVNEMPYSSTQNIEFGVNLLDVSNSINGADICTSLVPIGADELNIYNVPDTGSKESPVDGCYHKKKTYTVIHAASEALYGRIQKTKTWSDITDKESLYAKAVEYLKEQNTDIPSIECSAAELHYLDEHHGETAFKVGQLVRVVSPVHGIIGNYPLLKISMSLNSGAKRVTIGTPPKKELTDIVKNTSGTSSRNTTGGSTGSGSGGSSGGSGYVGVKDVRLKKPGDIEYESTVKNKVSKIDLSNMVKDVKLNGTSVVTEGQALLPAYPTIPVEDVLYGGSSLVVNKKAIIPPYPTIPVRDVLQGGSSLVVNGNAIIPPFPTIPVEDVLMGGSSLVVNGQAIIPIEPNPEDETTEDLESIKIGDTVYKLKGSGGGGEQYTCDLLFENDPLPAATSGTSNITRTYTLDKSIDEYDAVVVMVWMQHTSSETAQNMQTTIYKQDYYLRGTNQNSGWIFLENGSTNGELKRLVLRFEDSTNMQTISSRSGSGNEPILHKIYGLKFTSSVTVDYPEIYSEDEREIGIWIDGKPLYQKTIYLGTLKHDTKWHLVNHNISDIDTVVRITGKINNANSSELYWYDLPIHRANSNNGITIGANETVIQYMNSWLSPNADCSVNLRYTKTTDQPGSGQWLPGGTTAIQYSEKEQIIGQWIDGKTLYQKTINIGALTKDSSFHDVTHNISDVDKIIFISGTAYESNGSAHPLSDYRAGQSSGITVGANLTNVFYSNNWLTVIDCYVTLRYTKTADTPAELKQQMLVTQKEFEAFAYKYYNYQYKTMSSYYDNNERVIGRWTDGKPLYQKTWTFDSNVSISNSSWSDIPVTKSEYNFERIINVISTDSVGTNNKIMIAIDDTSKTVIRGYACRNTSVTIKHLTMQYTKTTDVAGTGPTPGNIMYLPAMYSEEEREVGVWTDGKPLYQKTKILTGTFSGSMNDISSGLENVPIDNICYINALGVVSTGVYVNIPHVNRQNGNDNGGFTINPPNYTISLRFTTNWSMNKMIFTYRYTKTTDQPGGTRNFITNNMVSIPDIYSEEEREVGVWIDGKPLYQRSVVQDLTLSSSWQNYISASGIDIVDVEINKLIRNNDPIAPPFQKEGICSWVVRDNYLKMAVQGSLASEGWVLKSATIKYTKTTDEPGSGTFWKNATPTGSLVKDVIKNGTSLVNANGIAEIPTSGVEDVKVNHQSILNSQNEVNIDSYEYMWSVTAKSGAYSRGNNVFDFLSDRNNNYSSSIDYDKHLTYDRSSTYDIHSNMIYYKKEGEYYGEGYYLPPILRVMVQYNDDSYYYSPNIYYNEAAGSYGHQAVLTFNNFSFIEPYMDDTHDSDDFGGCITGIRMNRYLMYDLPHGKYSTDIREDGVWIDGHKIYTVTYDEVNRLMYNDDFYTLGQIANYVDDPVIIDIRVTCKREGTEGVITKGTSTGAAIEGHFIQEANTTNPWYFSIANKSGSRKYIGSVTVWFIKSGESVSDDSESS